MPRSVLEFLYDFKRGLRRGFRRNALTRNYD
jgi:hypothetical protein